MRLEHIRLENFRQFHGQQAADFSTFDDLNVTVFHGVNGAGKTSLFSGINWCLYNAGVEDIGELFSKRALAEAREGETVKAEVLIWFVHEANRFMARRRMTLRKVGQEAVRRESPEFSLTRIKASGDAEQIPNPGPYMNTILPANVRPYFFFDGEKMEDLTRADNREVEEAIRNIMRLPALERAEEHLGGIAADYRRQIRKEGSPELERLTAKEEELRSDKEKATARSEELREEIRLVRQQIADLEAKLREKESARGLQIRRDHLQEQLENLEEQEKEKVILIQRLANQGYVALLGEAAEKALVILDEKRERGEIPSGVREQFVKDLLEGMVCICGRSFQVGDEAHKELQSLLGRAASSKLESEVLQLGGSIRGFSSSLPDQMALLASVCRDHAAIKSSKQTVFRQLDDVKQQLGSAPEEEIAGLERRRSQFQRNLETAIAEQGGTKTRVDDINQQIEETRAKKRKAEAKEKKLQLLARKEELAQKAADAVVRIREEFFEHTRREIEMATKTVFRELAWKQDHFQDVRLDQDFRLEVIDRWGTPTRKELSAGERQILSLSFICAMAKVSGEAAPLVMDTPFGRLSGNHLAAVAGNLPSLASQLVLFVTDREWDEASRTGLEPRAGAQYELKFDSQTGCSEIREVSW